jgi:Putative prokaryotic signal transducing protein
MADEESKGNPNLELTEVYETTDPTLLPVLRSALEAAGIPYHTEGEESFGLLPLQGGFLTGEEPMAVEIHVPADRAEEARTLILTAVQDFAPGAPSEDETPPGETT